MVKRIIKIDHNSQVPYYQQIEQSILAGIEKKSLTRGDRIPSINQVCQEFNVSRDTVMAAFGSLKAKGVLSSQAGKGFFVSNTENINTENIFLLFDDLNSSKDEIYESFIYHLKGKAAVNIFCHHSNIQTFKRQICENMGKFTSYLVMHGSLENTGYILDQLPSGKLFLLDRAKVDSKEYPAIFQDFENDLYEGLVQVAVYLRKYRQIIYIQSGAKELKGRIEGFIRFCRDFRFNYKIVKSYAEVRPTLYDAYVINNDNILVELLKFAHEFNCRIGEKLGILSLNNCLLKEMLADGITSLSTDYKEIGRLMAEMVLSRRNQAIRVPSRMIIRNSL